jgi:hypothetical protein
MRVFIISLLLLAFFDLHGQQATPLDYLETINDAYQPVLEKQMDFARSLSQAQPPELVNRYRRSLLSEIRNSRNDIRGMPPFRGNTALRDSMVQFLQVSFDVVNEDYARLVNMEQISEESYDKMEAFLRAQEEAYRQMSEAARAMKKTEEEFAKQFGVRLENSDDRFARQLRELNETFTYYNKIYLIFFNAYQQELKAFRAVESQDYDKMEEERRKLKALASDGLIKLDRTGGYKGDRSLRSAASENLKFYLREAEEDLSEMVAYYSRLYELKSTKTDMEATEDAEMRKRLTDKYNSLVRSINASGKQLNVITNRLNQERAAYLDKWNQVSESFLKEHIK